MSAEWSPVLLMKAFVSFLRPQPDKFSYVAPADTADSSYGEGEATLQLVHAAAAKEASAGGWLGADIYL